MTIWWNTTSYAGRYLQLYIEETVNVINNTSTLNWKLSSIGGSDLYYTIAPTTVKINGTQVYYKNTTSWSTKEFPAAKGSVTGSITIPHNSDGTKTIAVSFTTRVYYSTVEEYGGSMTLTNIDRTPPVLTLSTSEVTAGSVKISVSSSTTCDLWDYTLDNWSTFTQYSSTAGVSNTYTISGLNPNTTYNVIIRARKKSNRVVGWSSAKSFKTLGGSLLNSVDTVTADAVTVNISTNMTVYSAAYTHELAIKHGDTTVLTITGITKSSGTGAKTITLTSAQRTTLLNYMSAMKSFSGKFVLTTKSGSTVIGTSATITATVQTTEANSAPTFSNAAGFTYQDTNSTVTAVTGSDQAIVEALSTLKVTAYAGTAKNGATISQYEANINGTTIKSSGTTLTVGPVNTSGNTTLTVKIIDSRGYSAQVSKTIAVAAYKKAEITDVIMRRVNEVEAQTQVNISASISKLMVSGTNKNAFQSLSYRYKKTSASSFNAYTTISGVTVGEYGISYINSEFITLDANYSYDVQFKVIDKLSTHIIAVTLAAGTPLLAKRTRKLGINNRNPQHALDVVGDIAMNGVKLVDLFYPVGAIYTHHAGSLPAAINSIGTWQSIPSPFDGGFSWKRIS